MPPAVSTLPPYSIPAPAAADVYPEHLRSRGYNAIALTGVANCWVNMVGAAAAAAGALVGASFPLLLGHMQHWQPRLLATNLLRLDALWQG